MYKELRHILKSSLAAALPGGGTFLGPTWWVGWALIGLTLFMSTYTFFALLLLPAASPLHLYGKHK